MRVSREETDDIPHETTEDVRLLFTYYMSYISIGAYICKSKEKEAATTGNKTNKCKR